MRHFLLLIFAAQLTLVAAQGSAQAVFRRAEIDSRGELRITLGDRRVIHPPRDSGQAGAEQIAISADHRLVGWVVLYPNCCTSYPIPLKLVLLRPGGGRTVISNGLPIWQWAFAADGRSVVIRQAPVHGDAPVSYERRDIRTGRMTASTVTDSRAGLPEWARAVTPTTPPSRPLPNES